VNTPDWLRFDGLEERWQEKPAPAAAPPEQPPAVAPPPNDPRAWCARLTELCGTRWGAASPLGRVLAELVRLVDERYAPGRVHEAAAAAELEARIAEWIITVEDLAEVQR